MSTAVLARIAEPHATGIAAATPTLQPAEAAGPAFYDPHPLLPVFIAGAVSLVLSFAFIGAIVIWLVVRDSGIMQ